MERSPVRMATEVPFSFDERPKFESHSGCARTRMIEMQYIASWVIFRDICRTNFIDTLKDLGVELVRTKIKSLWKNSDKRKTEWRPKMISIRFGLMIRCFNVVEVLALSLAQT
jgi:hypothetical protein